MKKSIYLFGGLIVLAVSADLSENGAALVQVISDALAHTVGTPAPESLGLAAYVAVHLAAAAMGIALATFGMLRHSDWHSVTGGGRWLHGIAGMGIVIACSICFFVVHSGAVEIEASTSGFGEDRPEDVLQVARSLADSGRDRLRAGFMLLGGSGGLLALAAIAGLKSWPPREDAFDSRRRAVLAGALLLTLLVVGALYSLLMLIDPLQQTLAGEQGDQRADIIEPLHGILSQARLAFGALAFLGGLQIVAALVAPTMADEEEVERRYAELEAADREAADGEAALDEDSAAGELEDTGEAGTGEQ